jgi:hypothetical protein
MSEKENLKEIINYWIEKTKDSLDSAQDELKAGRLSFSVNRIYYACFYAASALLMKEGLRFKKHSGVRASFQQNFVKTKRVKHELGIFYDEIFEARQRGDYIELVRFEKKQVEGWLKKAKIFVEAMKSLISKEG